MVGFPRRSQMIRPMHRLFLLLSTLLLALPALAQKLPIIKCPSPDKRFALRLTEPRGEASNAKAELIESASGAVLLELGEVHHDYLSKTLLVWSADSKWVAYGTRRSKDGDADVYRWDGSAFQSLELPEDMPDPKIDFGSATGGVKNYGGAAQPRRWIKPGQLEMTSDLMMLSRGNGRSYTGVVRFEVVFDAQGKAVVRNVGRTKTTMDG